MKKTLSILLSIVMTFTFLCSSITVEAMESESETSLIDNNISINGTNSFGQLMSETLAEEENKQESNNGFNVFSAEVTVNTVTAEYEVLETCTMLAAIYDEDGESLITSGKTEVTPEEDYAEVIIENDNMPQYFYLRIFLIDSETLSPLCTAYESPNYTQEMQEFFAQTTNDFDEERVLNLDDNNLNNFAVFSEDVIIPQSNDNLNTVVSADDENGIYILENIDETVSGLENGDIFSCEYGEDNILIAKVSEIEINGTTAVITSGDTSLDEVFDYVKIDSSSGLADADIDYDSMDEGIEYIGTEDNNTPDFSRMITGTESENTLTGDTLELEIASKKIGKLELSGSLSLGSSVSVKTYISLKYQYFELKVENKLGFKISLSGSATSPAIVKLPPIDYSPVPGLYVGVQPALQIKFSGSISFTGGIKSSVGFSYDSDRGFKNITSKPQPEDMTISAEAKLFLGLIIEPRIVILHDKIAKAGFKCTSGVEVTANLKKKIGDYDSTHECKLCIDGDTSAKASLSCELTFFGLDNLTWEHTFADWSVKLNDFYYSIDKKEFGWGSCPYDKYKISVQVLSGGNDFPSGGAIVKCGEEKNTTGNDGIAEILLSDGYHTITVSKDNCETVKKKIFVNGDDKTITVHISAIDPAHTSTTTAVKPTESTQTVTTTATTIPEEQPDENGEYIHDGVIYKCYDDYAVVSGYTNKISSDVVLSNKVCGLTVTEIGDSAFEECEKLTSVIISESVTSIGNNAFYSCINLTSITIPDSVTSIGVCAFKWCSNLTSVVIPDDVTIIQDSTFEGCRNLTSITIPDNVTNIGNDAFFHCTNLMSITIPDSVTSIGRSAFCGCESLTSIEIPNGIKIIEEGTFNGCNGLTSITIPDGVTSIGTWAIRECDNLISIILPNSITNIGSSAIVWCDKLKDVYYSGTESEWDAIEFSGTLFYPSSVTIHYNSTGLDSEEKFNENGEYIHDGVVYKCYDDYVEVSTYTGYIPSDVVLLEKVCGLPVTKIGYKAFYNGDILTSITIPDSVTSIESLAFMYCSSLTSIIIPDGVTTIGRGVFSDCSGLTSVTIPDSVTIIYSEAFDGTPWLEAKQKENPLVIVNNILIDGKTCEGDVVIPNDVISISPDAFERCTGLTSIMIPDSVTYIDFCTFCECSNLTSVTIPDSVTRINYMAFYGCSSLTSITIPGSVTYMEHDVFKGCNSLISVTISNGVTSTGDSTFENCENLTSITIPNSFIDIGDDMFNGCSSLTSITIPDSVTNIGYGAFYKCSSLTSITIPNSVTNIAGNAFTWCDKLTDVYYSGTESEWNAITMDSSTKSQLTRRIHYNSTAPAPTPAPPVMTPYNETFADLRPNTLYNFYAFTDKETDDILSAENLLYIAQFTTDENGNFNIPYMPTNDRILIVGTIHSIATADINISDVVYTGSEVVPNPVVTWNNTQLTKGVDYETDGDLSAVDIGSYKILFNGIGEFFGYTTVIYDVVCSHNFADGICTVCGETETINQIVLGDVNEDGMVDAIDATAVLVEYANLSTVGSGTFSDEQKSAGDVNFDNMIDAVDASMILAFYAYLSTGGAENDMRIWLNM